MKTASDMAALRDAMEREMRRRPMTPSQLASLWPDCELPWCHDPASFFLLSPLCYRHTIDLFGGVSEGYPPRDCIHYRDAVNLFGNTG